MVQVMVNDMDTSHFRITKPIIAHSLSVDYKIDMLQMLFDVIDCIDCVLSLGFIN